MIYSFAFEVLYRSFYKRICHLHLNRLLFWVMVLLHQNALACACRRVAASPGSWILLNHYSHNWISPAFQMCLHGCHRSFDNNTIKCRLKSTVPHQKIAAHAGVASGVKRAMKTGLKPLVFKNLPLGSITPTGWLRTQLVIMVSVHVYDLTTTNRSRSAQLIYPVPFMKLLLYRSEYRTACGRHSLRLQLIPESIHNSGKRYQRSPRHVLGRCHG